ncbi:FUSC family protein [Actinomadura sp. PM05-2]|uniref:FUSC family protein n=2 Tax=Actinomadura parmotrematis TaxID=2864039 RepID=A0ABS7FZD8_9ACTN|nr:FUSC family protein [Actinomadura parmotrematis]
MPLQVSSERQRTVVRIARLTLTSMAAYLLALRVLPEGSPAPLLAPLTALLVVQFSLYETIRSGFWRVVAVTSGVVLAVLFATTVGFSWWSLTLTILAALVVGHVLPTGDQMLEVPISAMLIFAIGAANEAAAWDRILETLIGAGVGLAASLLLPPVRVRPAAEAVQDLADRLSRLLDTVDDQLRAGLHADQADAWQRDAERLFADIGRADRELTAAEDSLRFNPRARRLIDAGAALRNGVETMEHFTLSLRGLTRALADAAHLSGQRPLDDGPVRTQLADTLDEIALCIASYGTLARSDLVTDSAPTGAEQTLDRHIRTARERRDRLAGRLRDPAIGDDRWALYGEILMQVDRLIEQLRVEHRAHAREQWRRSRRMTRHLPERPARVMDRAGVGLRRAAQSAAQAAERNAAAADLGALPWRPRETAHSHHPPEYQQARTGTSEQRSANHRRDSAA